VKLDKAQQIIALYEQMNAQTQQMLDLASHSDWDGLVAKEHERRLLLEDVKSLDDGTVYSPQYAEAKAAMIKRILSCDEEIQKRSQGWMSELKEILDSMGAKKKIQKAYSTP